METLLPELVELICQYLTPQDLANCCAVSFQWRETFGQDWLWKRHCDPALEEPLRIIPSVVEPTFCSPEDYNPTLPEISKWRLAYMRQKHLCVNLIANAHTAHEANIYNDSVCPWSLPFLSDTLVVNCCLKSIEIWDVGRIPAKLLTKTDSSVNIKDWNTFRVLGNNMVLVEKSTSIQLFLVDDIKKSIKLKHEISLDNDLIFLENSNPVSLNGSIFLLKARESTVIIFDLGKGEKIKEVQCPFVENKEGNVKIRDILTSNTSDDVLVTLHDESYSHYYCIFSLKQQVFLADLTIETPYSPTCIGIIKHYVAFGSMPSMTIIDYHTSEILFNNEGQQYTTEIRAYKDSFIFLDRRDNKCLLKMFSLKTKTLTTLFEYETVDLDAEITFQIVNGRLLILFCKKVPVAEIHLSIKTPGDSDFILPFYDYNTIMLQLVNSSFTRICCVNNTYKRPKIYYYW